jgi:hypothetical protein
LNINTIEEVWKDINGYESSYMISNLGRAKSLDRVNAKGARIKGKLLKTRMNNSGYEHVMLYSGSRKLRKNLYVHRLVAEHFIKGDNSLDINHKDGNKLNNRLDNLERVSKSENTIHGYSNGLMKRCKKVELLLPDGTERILQNLAECSRYFGFNNGWVKDRIEKLGNPFEYKGYLIKVI